MNKYKVLSQQEFTFDNYTLIPIREMDIELIRIWRNQQIDILRQNKPITHKQQAEYYEKIIKKSFNDEFPTMILFSLLHNDSCIGYGGLTNIDWNKKNTELSFLVDTQRTNNLELYEKDFSSFLNMIFKITYDKFHFNSIFTETYDLRPNHISILEKNGFKLTKRLKGKKIINATKIDVLIHFHHASDYQ